MSESNWRKLSRVDVSHGVEVKHGGLSYLSWSVACASLMDHFPQATYEWLEPIILPNETVMVRVTVTVDGLTHEMQLPVLDHRNKPLANPSAFDYNSAQMRCLVKCIAMHGIGISLYLGDMKSVVTESGYERAQALIDAGDAVAFHQFINSLPEVEQVELFNGAPPGKKSAYKEAHRAMLKQAEQFFTEVKTAIEEAIANDDSMLLAETVNELTTYERQALWARLDATQQSEMKRIKA
jgi:hypothetical protein